VRHGGGLHRRRGLFPHRLSALERTRPALHEAHHGDGLGAAADGGCEILAGLN
jgi:hypothetical protein